MATDFIEGSATFTSGSNVATAVTLTQNTLSGVAEGVIVKVSSDPVIDNVEAVKALAVDSFQLRNVWPHATGTYTFMMNFSPEAIKSAATVMQQATDALNDAKDSYMVKTANLIDVESVTESQDNINVYDRSYFGDAATKTVVTSSTDATIDSVLLVGADESQLSSTTKETIVAARVGNIGLDEMSIVSDLDLLSVNQFARAGAGTANRPGTSGDWDVTNLNSSSAVSTQLASSWIATTPNIAVRVKRATWGGWEYLWTTANTTVDGSGFIKEASPIVKLFADHAEFNEQCPNGAEYEKASTGHYLIKNTLGFASKGWYIETPKDANNNVKCYVEYEQLEDNTIEIKTFEPDYTSGKVGGTVPMDITVDRWIDLRLEVEPVIIDETLTEDD